MPIATKEIVARLCREAANKRFPLGAVRAQKLIYLLECEFYRWEQQRLTSEQWIYYHYGPWSPTLDALLRKEFRITPEILENGHQVNLIEYQESDFYRLPDHFSDFVIQGIFERIVERWFTSPLNELLDYVYFHTAPMMDVQRKEILDFSTIVPARMEVEPLNVYKLAGRQKSKAEKIKQALAEWRKSIKQPQSPHVPFDKAAMDAVRLMDENEKTPDLDGPIEITRDAASSLPGDVG